MALDLGNLNVEKLAMAIMMWANEPWETARDYDYDGRTNYVKQRDPWTSRSTPVGFYITIANREDVVTYSGKIISRAAPNQDGPLMSMLGSEPGTVYVEIKPSNYILGESRRELQAIVEYVIGLTHFRCNTARHYWISRDVKCITCPNLLTCATKGWEVNT